MTTTATATRLPRTNRATAAPIRGGAASPGGSRGRGLWRLRRTSSILTAAGAESDGWPQIPSDQGPVALRTGVLSSSLPPQHTPPAAPPPARSTAPQLHFTPRHGPTEGTA